MLRVVTPATVEPVTLDEAKAHVRADDDSLDTIITAAITAAREVVELQTGLALAAAEWRWDAYGLPVAKLSRIPLGPIDAISAVTYADADGARQTVDPADYVADLGRSTIALAPGDDWTALSVEFTTAPANIPAALKAAILLIVGDLVANTEASVEKPLVENPAVQNLMFPYRRVLP